MEEAAIRRGNGYMVGQRGSASRMWLYAIIWIMCSDDGVATVWR